LPGFDEEMMMPVCFELISKETMLTERLETVDEKLAVAMGEAVHDDNWCHNWYNRIGIMLACGKGFNGCRECWNDPDDPDERIMHKVIDWLDKHYDVRSWRE
jgi:hypothetical protein